MTPLMTPCKGCVVSAWCRPRRAAHHEIYHHRVTQAADPRVRLVGRTEFLPPAEFSSQVDGGDALAEFAGRACYESFDRPRPETADNASYLAHILQVGHLSVLEHSVATVYLRRVSRSVVHEILRHRHFSYSELSPRHIPDTGLPLVAPDSLTADPELAGRYTDAVSRLALAQAELDELLGTPTGSDRQSPLAAKQVRQVSQRLRSGASVTSLVMTGNYRAWRHFVGVRATDPADVELRGIAVAVLELLRAESPHCFADFRISELADGSRMAASPLLGEG